MPEYLKIRHDVFPDFEVVELSEYKEKRNDYYEHWSVWKEAPPSEIPSTPTPGPNVQSFENESNSEELSMSEFQTNSCGVEAFSPRYWRIISPWVSDEPLWG